MRNRANLAGRGESAVDRRERRFIERDDREQ